MVSSGVVSGDLNSLKSILDNYNSEISSLDSGWKGDSHDNLVSKAEEFVSEYNSAIQSSMSAFANACDLYEEYITAKRNLEIQQANYNTAVYNEDTVNQNYYSSEISKYEEKVKELKEEIEVNLQEASSTSLSASSATSAVSASSFSDSSSASGDSQSSYTVNGIMQSVRDTAVNSSGGGYDNMCEAWAEITWQNATGITRQNQDSAYSAWQNFGVSESRDNIPVGAMVYGSGSATMDYNQNPYGHVGIYVGDGQVADQAGVTSLDNWLSWQTAECDGHVGWIGWGWQNGVDLSKSN